MKNVDFHNIVTQTARLIKLGLFAWGKEENEKALAAINSLRRPYSEYQNAVNYAKTYPGYDQPKLRQLQQYLIDSCEEFKDVELKIFEFPFDEEVHPVSKISLISDMPALIRYRGINVTTLVMIK